MVFELRIRFPGADRVERLILISAMASRLPQLIIDRACLVEEILDTKGIDDTYEFYFSGTLFDGVLDRNGFQKKLRYSKQRQRHTVLKAAFE